MKYSCGICRKSVKALSLLHRVVLLAEEKTEIARTHAIPIEQVPSELFYCLPCWKVATGPQSSTLLKGMLQARLSMIGFPDSSERAGAFLKKLTVKKTK